MLKFKRWISIVLTIAIMVVSMPNSIFAMSQDVDSRKMEFANKYSGVDLIAIDFNREQMNVRENQAYDELLEIMYLENIDIATEEGYSKEEYIKLAESILSNQATLEKYSAGEISLYSVSYGTRSPNGLISTKMLGGILNGVITAILIASGIASVGELIKKMGKEAAKEWVEKHVKRAIIEKLTQIGLGKFGFYAGSIITGIIDAYWDPGGLIAERIDSIDKYPNNGYIELW